MTTLKSHVTVYGLFNCSYFVNCVRYIIVHLCIFCSNYKYVRSVILTGLGREYSILTVLGHFMCNQ